MRLIAVDWSGAKTGARKKIWFAEAADARLVRLENGCDREEIADHLVAEAGQNPEMVVGLDFAFSLPGWFLEEHGLDSAPELWEHLADEGAEEWLARSEPPLWGGPGKRRPDLGAEGNHYRRTESRLPAIKGIRPKSVFQIGGGGAVGTGSLRGMPLLLRLREAGFHIWPFDAPGLPLVIEIYPRSLTGAVNKSDFAARALYLRSYRGVIESELLDKAASSEDAFDAAVSAIVMSESMKNLRALPEADIRWSKLEGEIWHPS